MSVLSATMSDSAVVRMDGAISLIDQFPALAGVDLVVDEGEIVLVRGANGAGKSTLLRLCAGLAPLGGGSGMVLGHDLQQREERRMVRRETGLLAHETFLYDELTVEENLRFWAKANRVDPISVEPVLDRLDLAGRLRRVKVSGLSAGQRRRTSLAVMVCRRPRLWLLDEPHGGLDQAGRDFVDDLINHAIGFGATVLIASHDIERATDLATRVVTIAGGQITDHGGRPPTDRSADRPLDGAPDRAPDGAADCDGNHAADRLAGHTDHHPAESAGNHTAERPGGHLADRLMGDFVDQPPPPSAADRREAWPAQREPTGAPGARRVARPSDRPRPPAPPSSRPQPQPPGPRDAKARSRDDQQRGPEPHAP